jgi:hypothetical protein
VDAAKGRKSGQAEVIAVRSHRSGVSFVLLVLATLILGWLMLAWWR